MRVLDDLCDVLEDELKEIVRSGEMSPTVLDNTYKVVDVIKDIKTIKAMEDSVYGNSYLMPDDNYSMVKDNRYRNMNRYSRSDEKEHLMAEMEKMKRQLESMK